MIKHWFAIGRSLALNAVFALALAATASASEGTFTRAEADSDWTLGSISGVATWSGCPVSLGPDGDRYWPESSYPRADCSGEPYVTVGPGSTLSDCSAMGRWPYPHPGDDIIVAWRGDAQLEAGSQSFDLEVPLAGEEGRLACLSMVETIPNTCVPTETVVCAAWYSATAFVPLASVLLTRNFEQPSEQEKGSGESWWKGTGGDRPEEGLPELPHVADGDGVVTSPPVPASGLETVEPSTSVVSRPRRRCNKGKVRGIAPRRTKCLRHRHRRHSSVPRN